MQDFSRTCITSVHSTNGGQSKMADIGVGIVGTGWVAGEHIKAFQKNAQSRVVAMTSRTREGAQAKAEEAGIDDAQIYDSFEEMLSDPRVDAVSICSPPNKHPEQTIQAAEAGKHILIEKAAANDPESLGQMLRVVNAAGVRTVVSFVLHWNPEFLWIRRMLDEQAIGRVFYAEVDYWHEIGPQYAQYRWNIKKSVAGSTFLSAGCHAVDAIRWFTDDEPDEVTAYANQINPDYEYPTNCVGIIKFKQGAIGKVSSVFDVKCPYAFNVDLLGDKGAIRDNRIFAREFLAGATDWVSVPTVRPDSGDVTHHPFDGEISHFVDCVANGSESPVNLNNAARTHAVCYALDRSAEQGRAVRLDEIYSEIGPER